MANFTGERVPIDTSMTDYNLGYDQSGEIMGKAMAGAMDTIAGSINAAASQYEDYKRKQEKAEEEALQNQISSEVNAMYDEQLAAYGVNTGAGGAAPDREQAAINQGGAELAKLSQAASQGRVNPIMFKMKAYQLAKRYRTQFPHKGAEIDAMVQKATGFRPANALLAELESASNAERNAAAADRKDQINFIQDSFKTVGAGAYADVDLYSAPDELLDEINRAQTKALDRDAQLKRIEKNLDVDKKISEAETRQRNNLIADQAFDMTSDIITRTLTAAGVKEGDQAALLQTQNPDQARAVAQELAKVADLEEAKIRRALARDTNVSKENADMIVDGALGHVRAYVKALNGTGDLSVLANETFQLKRLKEQNDLLAEQKSGQYRAISEIYGSENAIVLMENYGKGDKALSYMAKTVVGAVAGDQRTAYAGYNGLKLYANGADAKQTIQHAGDVVSMINDIENTDAVMRVIDEFYDTGKINQTFEGKSATETFRLLIKPEVVDGIMNFGDPELEDKFREFILDGFRSNVGIREMGGNLGESLAQLNGMVGVKVNPDGTITPTIDRQEWDRFMSEHDQGTRARYLSHLVGVNDAVKELNGILKPVGYFVTKQNQDVNERIPQLLGIAGAGGGNKGFFNSILDWMIESPAVEGAMTAVSTISGDRQTDFATMIRHEQQILGKFDPLKPQVDRQTTGSITPRGRPSASGERALNDNLSFLGGAEGTDRKRGYDETLAYGKFTGGDVELTGMTLGEVKQLQGQMLRHPENAWNSSAVGRYQIVRSTLKSLQNELGLDDNTKFTPEVQDQMAMALLKRRGLDRYRSGKITKDEFMDNLASEWASLPMPNGRSRYSKNNAAVSREELSAWVDQIA